MISAFQSALSGLQAYGARVQSNSNNIANANTNGFKKTRVLLEPAAPQGVKAKVEQVNTAGTKVYQETDNGTELVELSNVDLGRELPESLINAQMYKANLKTIEVTSEMLGSLLKIKT